MANSLTVSGLINSVKVHEIVSQKTGELFFLLNINLTESRYKGKDDAGKEVYSKQYFDAQIWLKEFPAESILSRFGLGFHITLLGELEMEAYERKDGTPGINAKVRTSFPQILVCTPRKDQLTSQE